MGKDLSRVSKGILLVVSGPSGSGKSTIVSALLEQGRNLFLSVSVTTRKPRPGETDGEHYQFIDESAFNAMAERGEFLEWASYCGRRYGTLKAPILSHLGKGENVILEIEVQGANQVKSNMPEAVSVFVLPPDLSSLHSRLSLRDTEDEEAIRKRLEIAVDEIKEASRYDYVIVNRDIQESVNNLLSILQSESLKTSRRIDTIQEVLGHAVSIHQ
jgi:guanylate kinase